MRKLFGTDGVRGVANLEPMTSETAMKLGRAVAHMLKRREGRHQDLIKYAPVKGAISTGPTRPTL